MTESTVGGKEETSSKAEEPETASPPKEKLHSIMEAASALTSLGDEEEEEAASSEQKTDDAIKEEETAGSEEPRGEPSVPSKRYLPEHKKPDAAPTFPEKLMSMMKYAEEQGKTDKDYCVSWLPDGKSFVVRNPDEFTRHVVPKFFKQTKFSSFTRKLYRWGFRQINRGIGPDDPIIFGNEHFDRNNQALMAKMRSVTAAGTRKTEQNRVVAYGKRPFEGMYDMPGPDQKRFFFDHMLQQKASLMHQNPSLYGGMSTNGAAMPLTNALHPGMGMEAPRHPHHMQQQQHMAMMNGPPHMQLQQQGHGMPPSKPYEIMHPQHHHMGNSMAPMSGMNHQYHPHGMPMQQTPPPMNLPPMNQQPPMNQTQMNNMNAPQYHSNNNGQYNSPSQHQSTAEIVNAAIAALRYAN